MGQADPEELPDSHGLGKYGAQESDGPGPDDRKVITRLDMRPLESGRATPKGSTTAPWS